MRFLQTFLEQYEFQLDMFNLCCEFDSLNLNDEVSDVTDFNNLPQPLDLPGSTESSSSGIASASDSLLKYAFYAAAIPAGFFACRKGISIAKKIYEKIKAPLVDGANVQDLSVIGFGFRFLPGQADLVKKVLRMPQNHHRLVLIKDSLGVRYSIGSHPLFFQLHEAAQKVLLEIYTAYNGNLSRWIVLVCAGLSCTVWYAQMPGTVDDLMCGNVTPDNAVWEEIRDYRPFFDPNYTRLDFSKKML